MVVLEGADRCAINILERGEQLAAAEGASIEYSAKAPYPQGRGGGHGGHSGRELLTPHHYLVI
jgi:hypothetical protein